MPPFNTANESRFVFEISGTELLVAEFTAREEVSAPFTVDLTLASEDEIQFDNAVGQPGLLTILGMDGDRYFHGIVSQFFQQGMTGRFFIYRARLVPKIWTLSLERDCRIFQEKSVPDIVKEILKDAGITGDMYEFRLQGTYEPRTYCVQYRESDLDFISRLLEQEGIFYYFEHSDEKHLLIFGDSTVNYQPISGKDSIMFNPGGQMVPEEEAIYLFMLSKALRTGKYTLRDFDFEKPDLDLTADKSDKENVGYEQYDYPGEYKTKEEGKKLSQVRLEEAAALKETAEGKSVCPRLVPGFTFTLAEHDMDPFNITYFLCRITHRGAQPQVMQEQHTSGKGTSYNNEFFAIPSDVPFRPERKTPWPVVDGVQTAIVTGPSGEEIYTDKHGRIKVQFHWDRLGKNDENSSCWIRVSQAWAGAGWGSMVIPRIGQEVIVDFIEGDPDRPIVTGRVYHGTNTPPYPLPENKTQSTMKSNSSKGGGGSNEIRMEDKKGQEEVYVHAQKDMNELVENDMSTTVKANRTIAVEGTHTETITKDTSITVTKGNYSHDVQTGTGTYHVQGDVTETYDATQTTTAANDIDITSAGGHVHITAATQIHLKVGASELLLKSDGSIKLKGVDIAIEGASVNVHGMTVTSKADTVHSIEGATVMVQGAATVTLKGGMIMLNP